MKRVLIVTPNWPPVSYPDLHRVRMALPYFQQFGWEPIILKIDPDEQQGAHGGHVERSRQRASRGNRSLETAIIILRHVQARCRVELDGRIIEDRGRGQISFLDRLRIEKGLQRRSRLTIAVGAIHGGGGRGAANASDISQDIP